LESGIILNRIFYFSGTGNSLQIAKDIADIVGDCKVTNLAKTDFSEEFAEERIGFVFPVYFWGLPLIVGRFLEKIKIKKDAYLFAVADYGIWPGKAIEMADDILRRNGHFLSSGFLIHMPDNYIISYGARSEKQQKKCFEQEKKKVQKISDAVSAKKNLPFEKSRFVIDRMLTKPVYQSVSKKFATLDLKFDANQNCTGCGLCERICPADNIKLIDHKPSWNHHCESCLACIQYCPAEAINYDNKTQSRKRYRNPYAKLPADSDRETTV
jgi:ferredoxin